MATASTAYTPNSTAAIGLAPAWPTEVLRNMKLADAVTIIGTRSMPNQAGLTATRSSGARGDQIITEIRASRLVEPASAMGVAVVLKRLHFSADPA